ncbi:MAG: zinc dependent phospholipase C family protein [Terracidiphilus sp.]
MRISVSPGIFSAYIAMKPLALKLIPLALATLFAMAPVCRAYSLLTHEQLIDLTWHDSIVPLILSRYPGLTPAQLDRARSYAYGGCVIQDIGYYPFGDRDFSNLTHYVRSGDFVVNLFRNAKNADELAFAIGALSHYIGDSYGHSEATNRAVPVEFPTLEARYGPVVSYAEGQHQHVQTEFAFDIDQIAHQHLAPLRYLRHIGLNVPAHQLGLAFYQTYGLTDFADHRAHRFKVKEYRFAVRTFIPRIAYAVTLLRRKHEPGEPDTPEATEIDKEALDAATLDNWNLYRTGKPSLETRVLAVLLFILPKVGPLSLVNVKGPTTGTEADYLHSVSQSTAALRYALRSFTPVASRIAVPQGAAVLERPFGPHDLHHPLPNRDLDTGYVVKPGGYSLTDSTYASLLHRLAQNPAQPIPPGIKRDIETYYSDPSAPITTKKHPAQWAQVQADLKTLAAIPTSNEPEPYPTYDSQ